MKYKVGIDIGSTTIKMAVINPHNGKLVLDVYQRHQAQAQHLLSDYLHMLKSRFGNDEFSICFTGSVGMGTAERLSMPFVQEVVATANYV